MQALRSGHNQYAPGLGAGALRRAVAAHAARFQGLSVDPDTMVVVTCGATEAIFDAVQGLVDVGDEVVTFEPVYDSYAASVAMAGGVLRPVTLHPPGGSRPQWWFEPRALEEAFSSRTRLVLLNTPHNPTGKVFTTEELEQIAALCRRWNAVAVVDEVYQHLVYGEARHASLATLPGMADRTLTVSSGAKTFGFTGWKVGWAMGPKVLRDAVLQAHQYVTFAVPTPSRRQWPALGCPTPTSPRSGPTTPGAAPGSSRCCARRVERPGNRRGLLSCTDVAGRGFADDDAFADLTTRVGGGDSALCLYVDAPTPRWSPLRVLQVGRDARRGSAQVSGAKAAR